MVEISKAKTFWHQEEIQCGEGNNEGVELASVSPEIPNLKLLVHLIIQSCMMLMKFSLLVPFLA